MYTIKQMAELAGVSPRTLRWYEREGLLTPERQPNGYRHYGTTQVERLQQILFYRELGFELKNIAQLMNASSFDPLAALNQQLDALKQQRQQTDRLITAIENTIRSKQTGAPMTDTEKFEAFKREALAENEAKYGTEIRERYGDAQVEASNQKFTDMSEKQYKDVEKLSSALNEALAKAVAAGDPHSDEAAALVEMHKQWLCFYWTEYSAEAHRGLAQGYVDDKRFTAYYETVAPGAAIYLRDAIHYWVK